jgi:sugar lactone lactonase YvrE
MGRILGLVVLTAALLVPAGSTAATTAGQSELQLPGEAFFPESVTAAPNGALFVSSLTTGDIVRFAPGSSTPAPFVTGVNVGTAGVMADPIRNVLWACAVDLSLQTPSQLRAFDLRTGGLEASYPIPDGGLCADIALARGHAYVTDTLNGRILRLRRFGGGRLEVWSDDPQFARGAFLKINGIAFDRRRTLYTTNYSTGELFAVRIEFGGAARPAVPIRLDEPMTYPDGIRWRDGHLYVAENANGLSRVDPRTATRKLIDDSLDQPSSLAFFHGDIWITEGQVLRLQAGEPPSLPFAVVRRDG